MPPKNKISKEDIVEAAFLIAKDEGFSGITARKVASSLNCSTAPIYVNFKTIEHLIDAVVSRVFTISQEYLDKQEGKDVFENIGKASIAFAQEYPVFLRELLIGGNSYMDSYDAVENHILNLLAKDETMGGWTEEEKKRLLLKMRIFQTGISVMIANGQTPSWLDDKAAEDLLMEIGGELLSSQKKKREGEKINE